MWTLLEYIHGRSIQPTEFTPTHPQLAHARTWPQPYNAAPLYHSTGRLQAQPLYPLVVAGPRGKDAPWTYRTPAGAGWVASKSHSGVTHGEQVIFRTLLTFTTANQLVFSNRAIGKLLLRKLVAAK